MASPFNPPSFYPPCDSSSTAAASASSSPSWIGHASPNGDTDGGSDFSASSPPASDDGLGTTASSYARREDWDLLSEMLVDESMPSGGVRTHSFLGENVLGGYDDAFGAPPHKLPFHPHQQPTLSFAPPLFQQNQQPLLHSTPVSSSPVMPVGFLDALLEQDDALLAAQCVESNTNNADNANANNASVGSSQSPALLPPQQSSSPPSPSSSSESERSPQAKKARKLSSALSEEEAKKLKRRSQIASSVQRHREKKKCLVATLKHDLVSLTSHLESLRSQRKQLHANNETLVAWEESAITERRKRKQSEAQNAQLKTALFQQTCFLMGMRSIMTNIPAPRELHIHDWLHSYTVLTAQHEARRREYAACFSASKMALAKQIVMRETDVFATRLTLKNPYYSGVRVLHDGTDELHDEADVRLKKELSDETEYAVPGSGQVVKKYTSMFLFEERGQCTLKAFQHVALEATKAVGVFWPSAGYQSHALDMVTLEENASSHLIFSDLHGSMAIIDDQLTSAEQDVQLEARMMCRIEHGEDETTIVWDYADKDELYPIAGDKAIRRDACGAAIVRREPGGKISFRSVCVKIFGPLDSHATASSDVRALTQRRISLQASELERQKQKCTRSVYDSLAEAFPRTVGVQP